MEEVYVITTNGIVKKSDAADGFIREISKKEELEEIIERIPYIQTIQAPNNKARKELYQLAMDEYDEVEWVKVIKSVYLRMEERHYEEYEPVFMDRAKQFLYGEMALIFGIAYEEVETYIKNAIDENEWMS